MYNKENFHNALALALGYEQIVKDKRLNICVDDSNDDAPIVTISVVGTSVKINYNAIEDYADVLRQIDCNEQIKALNVDHELMNIFNAVNSAYKGSLKELAIF